jgi:DNA-binding NarL/FixJ family response regulator
MRAGAEPFQPTDRRATEPGDVTVLLADDHVASRVGIRRAIEACGLRVIAEASDASEAVRMAVAWRPDVCVVSVALPGNGIEAVGPIKQALPAARVVMITLSVGDEELFASLRAGADGYLPMSTSAERLPYAIRGVTAGEAALPRDLTARLIVEFRERGMGRRLVLPGGRGEAELTAREYEVLSRLGKRERTAQIAARLGISEVTVRRHVSSVLRKLGTSDRRAAIELLERAERG